MKYLILVILWISWCGLHSALISSPVTEYVKARFPDSQRYNRLLFNAISVITLVPVVLYSMSISGPLIVRYEGWGRVYQVLLFLIAHVFFISGAKAYDIPQFLGLRQIRQDCSPSLVHYIRDTRRNTCSVLTEDCSLSGGMIIIWARNLDMAGLITNLVLTGYLIVGTFLEERRLVKQFGQEYIDYQQRVSMFLPFKWVARKLSKHQTQ